MAELAPFTMCEREGVPEFLTVYPCTGWTKEVDPYQWARNLLHEDVYPPNFFYSWSAEAQNLWRFVKKVVVLSVGNKIFSDKVRNNWATTMLNGMEEVCDEWGLDVPETNVPSAFLRECLSKAVVQWVAMAMNK